MSSKSPKIDELRAMIRAVGLRSTGPRIAVLRHLMTAPGPLSHGEIADALAEDGFDRATIYRNLSDLTEVKLVVRADRGDHIWRFEIQRSRSGHVNNHPHFVCNDCGTVSCIPETILPAAPVALPMGRVSEVLLKGTCNACA